VRTLNSDVETFWPDFSRVLCAYLPKNVARASRESRLLDWPEIRSGDHAASWLGFPAGNCRGWRTGGIRVKSGR
jgi:hypothetical protein